MSAYLDTSKDMLRAELASRIRECLVLRDWHRLEHWARHWIQVEPKNPSGFKWLARASVALNRIQKAAYAYGRILDFEPGNEEAQKFFSDYPSSLRDQPATTQEIAQQALAAKKLPAVSSSDDLQKQAVNPDQRRIISSKCLELAEIYSVAELHLRAAQLFEESHDWHPSQTAALGTARALHKSGMSPKATQWLKKQLTQFPQWIEGRLLLGRILFEIGQSTEAQREWQGVLKIDAENKEALNFLRNLLSKPAY